MTKRKLFLGDYSDNFELVKDVDSGTYTINVTKPLETELLDTEPDIILTLQAKTDDVDNVGTATLVIRLPKIEVLIPAAFSNSVYKASYIEDGPAVTSDTIELTGDNLENTVITISSSGKTVLYQKKFAQKYFVDYSSYFKLSASTPYTLEIEKELNDDTLNKGGEIVLTLEAKLDKSDIVNFATLIVSLPAIPLPPKFSQSYYEGKYTAGSEEGTIGNIKLSDDIKTDQDGSDDLSVTVSDSKYQNTYHTHTHMMTQIDIFSK